MIQGVLVDLSGTVYQGDAPLPKAIEAIEMLHEKKMPLRYLTNTSRTPRRKIHAKLLKIGLAVDEDEIFTAPQAIVAYLERHKLAPWLLVHPDIEEEFAGQTDQAPGAVVVGDAAHSFSYEHLNQAFRYLLEGSHLLAVGDNRYFRDGKEMSLDAGPFVKALEFAAGCEAIILGKPSAMFFHTATAQLGCRPDEVLMIGDDVESDVNGAIKAGLKGALVKTGKYREGDEGLLKAPGACVCRDLYEAVQGVLQQ